MMKDRLIPIRPSRIAKPAGESAQPDSTSGEDAFSLLALAASQRMGEATPEQERIGLIGAALAAGQEANAALADWLSQTLCEYRGSRSVWDLRSAGSRLERALTEFGDAVREGAARFRRLRPDASRGEPTGSPPVPEPSDSIPRSRPDLIVRTIAQGFGAVTPNRRADPRFGEATFGSSAATDPADPERR
jgi:hypothetical protein